MASPAGKNTKELKTQAVQGIRWTSLGSGFSVLFQLAQMIILARLLAPEVFGLMAMVLVVIRICNPIVEAGLLQAVIYKQDLNQKDLSTLYWVNILLGLSVFFIVNSIRFGVADFFLEPALAPYIFWTSLVFLIGPWGQQFQGLLSRDLRFDILAIIQIISQLIEFTLSVTLAYMGWGIMALIFGYLSRIGISSLCYIFFGLKIHTPVLYFKISRVSGLIRFGLFEAGNQLANLASTQVDKVLIGRLLGAELLGLYTIAWELIVFPIARINPIITKVAFPVYARLQHETARLSRYYRRAVSTLLLINVPALLGMAVVAEEFLEVFYGPTWTPAATALSILALTGILKTLGNPSGGILLAKGRSDVGFYWNIAWTAFLIVFIGLFLYFQPTLEMAASAQLIAALTIGWILALFGSSLW